MTTTQNASKSNIYGIIMAGGSGTRFWPLSRKMRPKQLLALGQSQATLIQATATRLDKISDPARTYIVTGSHLNSAVEASLPGIPANNILGEPMGRNTAPCVAWAASHVYRKDPNAVMAVLPADQHIGDEEEFERILKVASEAASEGKIVTVGIVPTRAETGYGYIERGEKSGPIEEVKRFTEKPDAKTAQEFVHSGRFLWNAGMFFFRADVIREAFKKHAPEIHRLITNYEKAEDEQALVNKSYQEMPSVSIDVAIMEKVDNLAVIAGDFGWSDVGSWTTAWELAKKDEFDNAEADSSMFLESKGCYATTTNSNKVISLVGVQDLVVVDTEDALLVMPREQAQKVRDVVEQLKANKKNQHL